MKIEWQRQTSVTSTPLQLLFLWLKPVYLLINQISQTTTFQTGTQLSMSSSLGINLHCELFLNDQLPRCPGSPTCFYVSLFPQKKKLAFLSTPASMGDLFQNANEEAAEQVSAMQPVAWPPRSRSLLKKAMLLHEEPHDSAPRDT